MVLRLRAPRRSAALEIDKRDGALIRDEADLAAARSGGFKTAVFLEGAAPPCDAEGFDVKVRIGARFGHLGDGDVSGLDPGSLRVRVLSGGNAMEPVSRRNVLAAAAGRRRRVDPR
jgi:hypothetical protein